MVKKGVTTIKKKSASNAPKAKPKKVKVKLDDTPKIDLSPEQLTVDDLDQLDLIEVTNESQEETESVNSSNSGIEKIHDELEELDESQLQELMRRIQNKRKKNNIQVYSYNNETEDLTEQTNDFEIYEEELVDKTLYTTRGPGVSNRIGMITSNRIGTKVSRR